MNLSRLHELRAEPAPPRWAWLAAGLLSAVLWVRRCLARDKLVPILITAGLLMAAPAGAVLLYLLTR